MNSLLRKCHQWRNHEKKEFILIHNNKFTKNQPHSSKTLNDTRVQHTAAQLFYLNHI